VTAIRLISDRDSLSWPPEDDEDEAEEEEEEKEEKEEEDDEEEKEEKEEEEEEDEKEEKEEEEEGAGTPSEMELKRLSCFVWNLGSLTSVRLFGFSVPGAKVTCCSD
jgi:hypothetical protein